MKIVFGVLSSALAIAVEAVGVGKIGRPASVGGVGVDNSATA